MIAPVRKGRSISFEKKEAKNFCYLERTG